jgi:hypothetical protein
MTADNATPSGVRAAATNSAGKESVSVSSDSLTTPPASSDKPVRVPAEQSHNEGSQTKEKALVVDKNDQDYVARYSASVSVKTQKDQHVILLLLLSPSNGREVDEGIASPKVSSESVKVAKDLQGKVSMLWFGKVSDSAGQVSGYRFKLIDDQVNLSGMNEIPLKSPFAKDDIDWTRLGPKVKVSVAIAIYTEVAGNYVFDRFLTPVAVCQFDTAAVEPDKEKKPSGAVSEHPDNQEAFIVAWRTSHDKKDIESLASLVYWGDTPPFLKAMWKTEVAANFKYSIKTIEFKEAAKDTNQTFNLTCTHWLIVTYDVTEDSGYVKITGTTTVQSPVASEGKSLYILMPKFEAKK